MYLFETTIQYFYSALAQTIATAFGFIGIVVFFKLQNTMQALKNLASAITAGITFAEHKEFEANYHEENWNSFTKYLKENDSLKEILKHFHRTNYANLFVNHYEHKERIIASFIKTLVLTIVGIVASFLLLSLSRYWSVNFFSSFATLGVGFFLIGRCFAYYLRLIFVVLDYEFSWKQIYKYCFSRWYI